MAPVRSYTNWNSRTTDEEEQIEPYRKYFFIQSMLTWKLAKDVMKDKQLRRMYYEKYGEKYKVKKEKRWWERG